MKCPKCNCDIDDNMLVCPNCKKVLKLVCPKCNTVNKNNVCKKCGFPIITKCHNCGKVNQVIDGKCSKCGFSTFKSVMINSSNIDEFACLLITFPNLEDLKKAFGSTKLYEKFKINLDKLISGYVHTKQLNREIIDDVYVIRYNKNFAFGDSANAAVSGAIDILNSITELNFKLSKLKDMQLQCSITVVKRDINSLPKDYKSGFNIKLLYQGKTGFKLLNGLQVITDSSVYEKTCDNYDLSSLSSTFVNKQMVMFFELNIKKYVKIPEEQEDTEIELPKLPVFEEEIAVESDDDDEIYNIDAITFEELKCDFVSVDATMAASTVLEKINSNSVNILSLKFEKDAVPDSKDIVDQVKKLNKFENIYRVICHDGLKYKPYGFFQELITNICKFTRAPKLFGENTFEMFNVIDPSSYVANLINAVILEGSDPEAVRYALFDIFFNIFSSIPNSLICIEDFDKIDETSYEILQLFFENVEKLGVSYFAFAGSEFKLHKDVHLLLSSNYYTEITLKPSTIKAVISQNAKRYKPILSSYYIGKIAHSFRGSLLYFNQAINFLIDKGVYVFDNNELNEIDTENILLPVSLKALVTKRIRNLLKDKVAFKLFGMLLLVGPIVDLKTFKLLNISDDKIQLKKLIDRNYIYVEDESIYFKNYNLLKECFLSAFDKEDLQEFAEELLTKVYGNEIAVPEMLNLYSILGEKVNKFYCMEQIMKWNCSLGDFSSYLCLSVKFLEMINDDFVENALKSKDEYKFEVYDNISNLLYKYSPEKIHNIAAIVIDNLEKSTSNHKIVDLCNKMLQGCLVTGNYQYALGLIRTIIASFPNLSVNPNDPNFNIAFFFISLIKIEILFSIGNLSDCIEASDEILQSVTPELILAIKPENLDQMQFEDMILDAMSFSALSQVILLRDNYEQFIEAVCNRVGRLSPAFGAISLLQYIMRGIRIDIPQDVELDHDRFSKILMYLLAAFNGGVSDYKEFAKLIYQSKIYAKQNRLFQIELICDLLIGYSYFKLDKLKKAASIYYDVLETSEKNNLKLITQMCWYFISVLKFEENNLDAAYGIANNAVIQIERDANSSDYLFFLFKIVLCNILDVKQNANASLLCMHDVDSLAQKYGISFGAVQNGVLEPSGDENNQAQTEESLGVDNIEENKNDEDIDK